MRAAIIVAGGSGRRMGGDIPKQFVLLGGKPILAHSIDAFHAFDPKAQIIVVLPADQMEAWEHICTRHSFITPHITVVGGKERFHSVQQGLAEIKDAEVIAIHDGVRPFISIACIAKCYATAMEQGSAVPVLPLSSSIRQLEKKGSIAVDRKDLRSVQTPQCFRSDWLRKAYEMPYDPAFTDDATLVERAGFTVTLVDGEEVNIKITTPTDLVIADALINHDK